MGKELFKNIPSKVGDLVKDVRNGRIGLPDLQRPFVWRDNKVRELFDSMLKGYPIGYIMLWESPADYESKKSTIGDNSKTYEEPKELVIDGQQRLTALVAAMFAVKMKDKNFADREIKISYNPLTREFAVWSQAYEKDTEWISRISDVFLAKEDNSISSLRRYFIKEANEGRSKKGFPLLTDEEEDRIEDSINALLNLSDYSLPTLEISYNADEEDVADIFVRVNSGGQSLTENNFIQTLISVYENETSDKINAFAAASRVPAANTSYNTLLAIDPPHLIRMAVGFGFKRARLKYAYMLLRGKNLETGKFSDKVRHDNLQIFKDALDKAINPGCVTTTNFILIYSKSKEHWHPNRLYTNRGSRDKRYGNFITNINDPFPSWNLITLTEAFAEERKLSIKEARAFIKSYPEQMDQFVLEHCESVIQLVNPDYNSVGAETRAMIDESRNKPNEILRQVRDGYSDIYLLNGKRIIFYRDKLKKVDGEYVPGEPLTTLWDDLLSNNLHNEGGVNFPKGKKPEALIKRCIELSSDLGDIVLDSFLGSGTTAAVAHKMKRRWIGIEMGKQAYTHCKPRIDDAIANNDASGITKSVDWQGGGGYRFYEVAPTLINKDAFDEYVINEDYDANMLAAAVALHEGFHYQPDGELFWKQSVGNENSYLFVTTRHLNSTYLDSIKDTMEEGEYLIIACRSFDRGLDKAYDNIAVKKIPQMLLERCEFGKTDYNLNIVHPPVYDDEEEQDV